MTSLSVVALSAPSSASDSVSPPIVAAAKTSSGAQMHFHARLLRCRIVRCWGAIILLSTTVFAQQPPRLQRFSFRQIHMGMPVRLVVYAASPDEAASACRDTFNHIAQLDSIFSDYRINSEVRRLSDRSGGAPMAISKPLYEVLSLAVEIGRLSHGAHDVTCGPLVSLWREARRSKRLPDPEALQAALALVGWQNIELSPEQHTARLRLRGMKLDLGGIAKGYVGDEAIRCLREHGIGPALFVAGGDIVAGDPPPGRSGWKVQLFDAAPGSAPKLLARAAMSTSGDTEQFVEIDGVRYSHIVDPRTGLGVTNRLAATVTAPRGILSDALATAVCVLGAEKGRELVAHFPGASVFVRKVGGNGLGHRSATDGSAQ